MLQYLRYICKDTIMTVTSDPIIEHGKVYTLQDGMR